MEAVMEAPIKVLTVEETKKFLMEDIAKGNRIGLEATCKLIRDKKVACTPLLAVEASLAKWEANVFKDDKEVPGYWDKKWSLGRTASTCPCCATAVKDKNGVTDCNTCLLGIVQKGACTRKTASESTYDGDKTGLAEMLRLAVVYGKEHAAEFSTPTA